MKTTVLIACIFLFFSNSALALNELEHALARETLVAFQENSFSNMKERFAPAFFAQISFEQMNAIPAAYQPAYGNIEDIEFVEIKDDATFGPDTKFFHASLNGGRRAVLRIRVDSNDQITSWHLGPSFEIQADIQKVKEKIRSLGGKVSVFAKVAGEREAFFELNADEILPIGSAFKLYVLCELLRQVENGALTLDQIVRLSLSNKSFGSGGLQAWPLDSPITVNSLAMVMISRSDNTATDHLIELVGREAIERQLGTLYPNSAPNRSMPFLKTREMFLLRFATAPFMGYRQTFHEGDLTGKRVVLKNLNAAYSNNLPAIELLDPPSRMSIEWFASTRDLGRLLENMYNGQIIKTDEMLSVMRGILALNPGIPNSEQDPRITYLGYKGGSEPGVLNLTQCVETSNGSRFFISMTSFHEEGEAQTPKMIELLTMLRKLVLDSLE